MTAPHDPSSTKRVRTTRSAPDRADASRWRLQDAKARFSELVRRVRSDGPQRVTVHGRDEVVMVSAEEYDRLRGGPTGSVLVAALQASLHRDVELTAASVRSPIRPVDFQETV